MPKRHKFSAAKSLKLAIRPAVRKRLVMAGLKGGAFSVWAIMFLFDIVWHVFIAPFIRKEQRDLQTKMREKRIKTAAQGIKEATTASELLAAHKALYAKVKK